MMYYGGRAGSKARIGMSHFWSCLADILPSRVEHLD